MITYFFKNNIFVGSSDGSTTFPDYDFVKQDLTEEQIEKISQGYIFQGDDLVQPEGWQAEQDEKQAQAKKQEANQIITSRYPLRKQINLNRLGGVEMDEMNTRIDAIRTEENTNGKDADFSQFIQ